MNSTVVRVRNVSNERCKIQSCRYYKGLQKVKWDCIGITEKLLGLQKGFRTKRAQTCLGFSRDSKKSGVGIT